MIKKYKKDKKGPGYSQDSTGTIVKTGKTYKTLKSFRNIPITDKQKRRR